MHIIINPQYSPHAPTLEPTMTPSVKPSASPTQKTVLVHSGYEYHLSYQQKSFSKHEAAAEEWGGHLASIHSLHELEFIKRNFFNQSDESIFIGGIRKEGTNITDDSDGSADYWEWSDGTPWDFVVWGWNQPNNINSNGNREDVVLLTNSGHFHDAPVGWKVYGLYKKVRYNDHEYDYFISQIIN